MPSTITQVLHSTFGFDKFRGGQEQVIQQILAGESSAAVFPTGSGKSLCYQLPALLLPGLTLVVSPLLALMKDQIDALHLRGVRAARLDSTLSLEEYQAVMADVRNARIKLLYVAPERFMNERFRAAMAGVNISLFAVDEAHCISEWGHNFRPDYLKLPMFARSLDAKVILALTATATPEVLRDIQEAFGVAPGRAVVTGFYRPNLTLLTALVSTDARDEAIVKEIQSRPLAATIVYVTLQKTAEGVAALLSGRGLNARHYHAGMKPEEREETQNWFIASDNAIVVATIAFGMGIDKANIRYVFHYNLPKSLENYSQEIGRAGRDGLPALCKMFASVDDLSVLENFVHGDRASPRSLHSLIVKVFAHDRFDASLLELSTSLDIKTLVLSTVMTYLELQGYLQAETPYYQSYEYKLLTAWESVLESVPLDRHEFLNGILERSTKKLIWNRIDVESAASAMRESRERLVTALNWLDEKGFIELKVAGIRHPYRVLRFPSSSPDLASEIFANMERREKKELARLATMLDFVVLDSCQVRFLGQYFGEDSGVNCGHCSYCLGERGRVVPPRKRASPEILRKALADVPALVREAAGKSIDAYTITRFLCGISSPILGRSKLNSRHSSFGTLGALPFDEVLEAVTQVMAKS